MSGWQPIETAPKDKSILLSWAGKFVAEGSYYVGHGWFEANCAPTDYTDGEIINPSHWQPLPEPAPLP